MLWTCEVGFFSSVSGGVTGVSQKLSGVVISKQFDMIACYVLTLAITSKRQVDGIDGDGDGYCCCCAAGEQSAA